MKASLKTREKEKLDLSRSAPFHTKTRVSLAEKAKALPKSRSKISNIILVSSILPSTTH